MCIRDSITAVLGLDNDLTEKIISENMYEQAMSLSDKAVVQSVYLSLIHI